MFISFSEANAALKHPVFKYQTTLEKKKLFVKGITNTHHAELSFLTRNALYELSGMAPTVTKEDVENLFKKFGIIKEVRMVTFKSGASKGN